MVKGLNKLSKSQLINLEEKVFLEGEKDSIMKLIIKIRDLMIEQAVNRESEVAYFYFLLTFFFILTGFVVMWYMATKFSSFSSYFNDVFCRSKKYNTDKKENY